MRELRYNDYYKSYNELRYNSSYVQGNNVLQFEPEYEEKPKKPKKPKLHIVKPKKRKKDVYTKAQVARNQAALFITMVALVLVSFSLIHYLDLQAQVAGRADEISELEEKYVDLKSQNDLREAELNGNIDYDNILSIAVNELGMVYANKDQIIVYNSEKPEVVKQLENIPEK